MAENKDPLFELILNDEEDEVFAISFVAEPAIEKDFVYFGKQKQEIKFAAVDNLKHLVAGPILIPNKKIIRVDEQGEFYHVFFTSETVDQIAHKYMMDKYNDKVTYEHEVPVKDVSLVESWIVTNPNKDKSNNYNMFLPSGTWFGIFKVDNPKLWEEVVNGDVKGFSIEGIFDHKKASLDFSKLLEKDIRKYTEEEAQIFLAHVRNIIKKDKRYKGGSKLEKETFVDYPVGVMNNAKRAIQWGEKNGWGKVNPKIQAIAKQFANKQAVSIDTIKKIYRFLTKNADETEKASAVGSNPIILAYFAVGGKSALGWTTNVLRDAGIIKANVPEDMISGPAYNNRPNGHQNMDGEGGAQPAITSTYPGEGPTKKKKKKKMTKPATAALLPPKTIGNATKSKNIK
jgi:hypothetical protein